MPARALIDSIFHLEPSEPDWESLDLPEVGHTILSRPKTPKGKPKHRGTVVQILDEEPCPAGIEDCGGTLVQVEWDGGESTDLCSAGLTQVGADVWQIN